MGKRPRGRTEILLVLALVGLIGCGTPNGAAQQPPSVGPATSPAALLVVSERVLDGGNIVPRVAAYQQGVPRWTFRLPGPGKALAAADGMIYVGAGETVYALDAHTGKARWQTPASPAVRAITVSEGRLYVDTGGGYTGQEHLLVLSPADGHLVWQYTPPALQDLPAWLVDGGVFYTVLSGFPASVVARDAATGTLRWQAPLQVDSPLQFLLPAGPDALLVVTQANVVLTRRSDGAAVWRRDQTQTVAPQVIDGTVIGFFVDQPAAFGGEPSVFLRTIEVQDGRLRWQQSLPSSDAGFLTSQHILAVGTMTAQRCYLADGTNFRYGSCLAAF